MGLSSALPLKDAVGTLGLLLLCEAFPCLSCLAGLCPGCAERDPLAQGQILEGHSPPQAGSLGHGCAPCFWSQVSRMERLLFGWPRWGASRMATGWATSLGRLYLVVTWSLGLDLARLSVWVETASARLPRRSPGTRLCLPPGAAPPGPEEPGTPSCRGSGVAWAERGLQHLPPWREQPCMRDWGP